jgi:hypothetical protein
MAPGDALNPAFYEAGLSCLSNSQAHFWRAWT